LVVGFAGLCRWLRAAGLPPRLAGGGVEPPDRLSCAAAADDDRVPEVGFAVGREPAPEPATSALGHSGASGQCSQSGVLA
jgi:hypothetical protein